MQVKNQSKEEMHEAESEVSETKLLMESEQVTLWCGCVMIHGEYCQLEKWPPGSDLVLSFTK